MIKGLLHKFGYDAAKSSKNRRMIPIQLKSEDKTLKPHERAKLLTRAREANRNYSLAAWAINKHLDYVSSFNFMPTTEDDGFNEYLSQWAKRWCRAENFSFNSKLSMSRFIRLLETCSVIDGDAFVLMLKDGRVQGIEGDRIKTPRRGEIPQRYKELDWIHGIGFRNTTPRYAAVHKRGKILSFEYERMVRWEYLLHRAYYTRLDQWRGITPLSSCINAMSDLYESHEYALAKMKVAQIFGLVTYRESHQAFGTDFDAENEEENQDAPPLKVTGGPFHVDLAEGEKMDVVESRNPSQEFQNFSEKMTMLALKGLDIPYSFFDEAHTNYSGQRQAWLQYEKSANGKREGLREILNKLTNWRLYKDYLAGELELPDRMSWQDIKWEWIATGVPWIDPLKEVKANTLAIDYGLASREEILKSQGRDFHEIIKQLQKEKELMDNLGVNNEQ